MFLEILPKNKGKKRERELSLTQHFRPKIKLGYRYHEYKLYLMQMDQHSQGTFLFLFFFFSQLDSSPMVAKLLPCYVILVFCDISKPVTKSPKQMKGDTLSAAKPFFISSPYCYQLLEQENRCPQFISPHDN